MRAAAAEQTEEERGLSVGSFVPSLPTWRGEGGEGRGENVLSSHSLTVERWRKKPRVGENEL
jgi:hypothetical protein